MSVQREQASYLAGQSALWKKPRIQPICTKYLTLMLGSVLDSGVNEDDQTTALSTGRSQYRR